MTASHSRNADQPAVRLLGSAGRRLWGLTGAERLHRSLRRAGIDSTAGTASAGGVLLLRTDYLYDESLIRALIGQPGRTLVDPADSTKLIAAHVGAGAVAAAALAGEIDLDKVTREAGLQPTGPVELAGSYDATLRKRATPYLLPLEGTSRNTLERASFSGAYKGATDFVTKYLWPWPARQVTRWCAALGISPNAVTFVSLLLVIAAFWLFWTGHFALGLVAAWGMTFLDTVDGKLARVTLTSTKAGEVFDHGIDLIHPPFWYWAWYVGLATVPLTLELNEWPLPALWVIVAGYLLGRAEEGFFMARFGIEIHIWRPVDYWFRTITARRNPNLAILTIAILFDRPSEGFFAVAIWTILSLLFHLVRIGQALIAKRRNGALRSWLTEAA
ncbi:MAG: CDP-alcohol phosphatidyltransferase family protein [Dongiaceae bacterium]